MGVPKFYRWISERYPCLSECIDNTEIPEFDNLYLDMNGLIHNCSHPNDDNIMFTISQEQIFADIFAYIEMLYDIIRPTKVFFLAVDGVAPRAKLNQQRSRRFLSARTAEEQLQTFIKKGGKPLTGKRFDPNCITPGTVFMTEFHKALSDWLDTKIQKDVNWRDIRVYLSGHDCPGEGEHKIMDFIRHERSLEGYNPNTRHCLYGLDADLIMLGICSHEPHFSLLREEIKFSRPQSKKSSSAWRVNLSQIRFHLLHISLLRDYLSWEFHPLKATLPFPYDVDRIVDDWVLMSFLVGNDFIPHLPHVHIHDDALPLLYQTYMQILPTLDGSFTIFITVHFDEHEENRSLSSTSFQGEHSNGSEESADDKAAFVSSDEDEIDDMHGGTASISDGGLQSASVLLENFEYEDDIDENSLCNEIAAAQLKEMDNKIFENDAENCWTKAISNSFRRHKRHYYREKMNYENITKSELREQAEGYVKAVQWNLYYYYRGCVSWSWFVSFYPHHYAPYISDVVDFSSMNITFDLGEPLKPLEQLLAVLPSGSSECLPPVLRDLMCSKESPIADFYPTDFTMDLNGKKNDWEAVVLIPFIDKERLLSAMETKMPLLSPEEKSRNSFGNILLFTSSCTVSNRYVRYSLIGTIIWAWFYSSSVYCLDL
ncbi:XRN 5'-3' exonuclease [Dictyocaulus viviparus]|uniref:5'-3' exoribonuclease n=1 Tax=Dictyocaulus viviparus TaxID=29172 RepID=A0A0D8Y0X5_DICVI|nr:XRN 5'-3' exonuclease [Dictyocaulus viviparus]